MSTYTFSYTNSGTAKLNPAKAQYAVTKASGDTEKDARRSVIEQMFNVFQISLSDEDLKLESTVP